MFTFCVTYVVAACGRLGRLGVAACLACVAVVVDRQAQRSCLVWRCELTAGQVRSALECVRRSHCARVTHSDKDQTQNAPVWRSSRLSSDRHTRHDKTVLSVSCLAWRCDYNCDSSAIRARYEHDTLQHAKRFFVRSHTRSIRALHENQW